MNFYNENDPKAAAWLRELIAQGHIPAGVVDERSIRDVHPNDLSGFSQCHFFAGIGGWSLALALAGWPKDEPVWTGSCPCQPFSTAGKQMGRKDPRHLWPAWRRLINRCAPPVVFGEQVASAAGRKWLAGVFANLETMAYAPAGADLCAASCGAPHIRQRLWWGACRVADTHLPNAHGWPSGREQSLHESNGGSSRMADSKDADRRAELQQSGAGSGRGRSSGDRTTRGVGQSFQSRLEGYTGHGDHGNEPGRIDPIEARSASAAGSAGHWDAFDLIPCRDGKARRVEPGTFPLAHGVSGRVGLLRGYGNAIVPQVAAEFIQAFREALTTPTP